MKNIIKLSFLLIATLFLSFQSSQAQKIGTLESQKLLIEMPEVKAVDAELEAYQKQLQKQGQARMQKYKAKEKTGIDKKSRGELSPKQEQTLLLELQKEQEELMALGNKMEQQMIEKRETLLKPIYEKVNDAINAVAEENGYLYIMDATVVSYADKTNDVTALVKAKLGL